MPIKFFSAATPKKIEMLMNVNSIDRKKISAHLQVHVYILKSAEYSTE
jgi:hypothetical protein